MLIASDLSSAGFRLSERTQRTIVRVQSLSAAVSQQGFQQPSGAKSDGDVRILCIAPGDWLLVADNLPAANLQEQLQNDASAAGRTAVDVTHAYGILEVSGHAARDVLAKGCGLDLHPDRFARGSCTRTRLAKIAVVIDCQDEHRFDLYVARSYSAYLQSWLQDAAVEFSCQ
jgi:sarcosine oxidase subunit gamma